MWRTCAFRPSSWSCVQGVFALFVEFVLEFEALVVGFRGAHGFDDGSDPIVHVPLTELARGDRTVTGVMIRKAGVPPDAGVNVFGQMQAFLVDAGFSGGPFNVHEVWAGDHGVRSFIFTGVIIDARRFLGRAAGLTAFAIENVNNVVVRAIELRLGEEGKQMLVSAVAVDDDD